MASTGDTGGTRTAVISVRQTTEESRWAGKACPKCSKPIEPGQQAVMCPKCYTPHHRDCWTENGNKCAIDGTPASIIERGARQPAAAAEAAPPAVPAGAPTAATQDAPAAPAAPPSPAAPTPVVTATAEAAQPAAATATAVATRATSARERPAAGATPATGATPAAPAAAAARPAARPTAAQSRTAMRSAARRAQAQLTVWPHLLMPEFLSAVLITIGLTVMAWFINAPLEEHSNPNRTPNPSKAPWYFLNLQELLLHMHPGLAGVIIPTLAIVLLMAIPYLDITTDDVGVWFSSRRGKRVFWISFVYTIAANIVLILLDKFIGIRRTIEQAIPFLQTSWVSEIVTQTLVPTLIIWAVSMLLYIIIAPMRPTVRDVMIAYFTAFAVTWVLTAIVGSAFRGQGMELFWPWDPGMRRIG